jgi:Sulfotransferase family
VLADADKAPIFVIGFLRGGTDILMNLLASHPDTRFVGRETHMVFYGKAKEPALTANSVGLMPRNRELLPQGCKRQSDRPSG